VRHLVGISCRCPPLATAATKAHNLTRTHISTRGIGSWRARLTDPDRQWKRQFSAFEAAVSWEIASKRKSGVPAPIEKLLAGGALRDPLLLFAVAEHKVDLPGGNAASQCDVWAVLKTTAGMLSLTVEAKAGEPFGDETLENWLLAGKTTASRVNREKRFEYIRAHLPLSPSFMKVRYQILHRCAASVMEAKRFGFQQAAFVVQAFDTPDQSFRDYAMFCECLGIPAARGNLATTTIDGISLSVGWADCPLSTSEEVAATV
jgi:hypothetical protein